MNVEQLTDVDAFLERAGAFLEEDEARCNLLLGIAGTIRADAGLYPQQRFWIVRDGDRIAATALRTPPYNLVLGRLDDPAALEPLAAALADHGELPGVVGLRGDGEAFAQAWTALRGVRAQVAMRQGVFALERVAAVPASPGEARVAGPADRELVLDWWLAFADEVLLDSSPSRDRAAATVDHRLHGDHAGVLLWEDGGETVSLAAWGGPTPNGIRIGPVYTPPPLRGRGYATALVAELSRRLLDGTLYDGGRRFCFLYTDLANPTSNAIYERIGYVRVAESVELLFERSR